MMENKYQLGDMVRFTKAHYGDAEMFAPVLDVYEEFDDYSHKEMSQALQNIEATVVGLWDEEGAWIKYKLFGKELQTNHFWFEIEPTGERRILNDPTRYDKALL